MTDALPEPDDYDTDEWKNPAGPDVHGWLPFTDAASRTILEAAVLDLVTHRGGCHDDVGVAISVLVSLLAEGECWLPELVADARDQSYSWEAISERLAITISAARHRYAAYAIWRRQQPPLRRVHDECPRRVHHEWRLTTSRIAQARWTLRSSSLSGSMNRYMVIERPARYAEVGIMPSRGLPRTRISTEEVGIILPP